MPRENSRKSQQASRSNSRLKVCSPALARIIGMLQKLPLDMHLIDVEQDEFLNELRSNRLSKSVTNLFNTKTLTYPAQHGAAFPGSEVDWTSRERKRVDEIKRVLEIDEIQYRQKYKRAQIEVLSEYVSGLGGEFADHILADGKSDQMSFDEMDRALARYNRYRFLHNFMAALVVAAETRQKAKVTQFASALPSGAYIGPNGRFRPKLAPIVEALNGVEVDRIRMCSNKNCHRVFWAGRIARTDSTKNDQVCCSPECSHAARNQRLRARYSDPRDDFAARKLTANEKWSNKKTPRNGK